MEVGRLVSSTVRTRSAAGDPSELDQRRLPKASAGKANPHERAVSENGRAARAKPRGGPLACRFMSEGFRCPSAVEATRQP